MFSKLVKNVLFLHCPGPLKAHKLASDSFVFGNTLMLFCIHVSFFFSVNIFALLDIGMIVHYVPFRQLSRCFYGCKFGDFLSLLKCDAFHASFSECLIVICPVQKRANVRQSLFFFFDSFAYSDMLAVGCVFCQ